MTTNCAECGHTTTEIHWDGICTACRETWEHPANV